MSYYSVLEVTPSRDDWIPGYLPTANAVIARHSGKYLARTADHARLEGEDRPAALRILIEWPSKDAAEAFVADPDYAPHLAARQAGSTSYHWLIAGRDDLA